MSEDPQKNAPAADSGWEDTEEIAWREMQKLYETMSFAQRMKRTINGLSAPKDSGEYKYARIQVQRMAGPIVAFLVPVSAILIMLSLPQKERTQTRTQSVQIEEATDQPEMEDEQVEPPEPEFIEPLDTDFEGPQGETADVDAPMDISNEPVSPQPREMNSVAMVKSPIVMKNILGSRDPGQRGKAMSKYGGAGGEPAVMKALRWLKKNQESEGSWPGVKPAMTSLALLTFLAHGEIPGSDHPEFGPCVQKGLEYLCSIQDSNGFFKGRDGNNYTQPIVLYALSEAYSMTKNPVVKQVAERAAVPLIKGQYASGTWAYNMKGPDVNQNYPNGDTSYAGWCAQAIKAAHVAELQVEGLDECFEKASVGFLGCYNPQTGGFGYNSRSPSALSAVGTLCMQLLGKWDAPEVKKTLELVKEAKFDWKNWNGTQIKGTNGGNPLYNWYYLTQAKFQAGGDTFKSWNRMFLPVLTNMQQVVTADKSGYVDETGKPRDIGYWDTPSAGELPAVKNGPLPCVRYDKGEAVNATTTLGNRVKDTCFCALQLMVYYRFLPASQAVNQQPEEKVSEKKSTDVKIGIRKKKM